MKLFKDRVRTKPKGRKWLLALFPISVWSIVLYVGIGGSEATPPLQTAGDMVVLGYNDLGMHCMGSRFGEICILPPFNTMRATVIDRTHGSPEIVTQDITVSYSIPGNTISTTKCDFWTYALPLFGVALPPNIGLAGNGLAGNMIPTTARDWIAEGVPITPIRDDGVEDAYQLALLTVKQNGVTKATTQAVMPVSWEMRCNTCHNTAGITTETDILRKHDRLHHTNLEHQKPVLCARCHADPALGAPGDPTLPNLSLAMHRSHANRFNKIKPIVSIQTTKPSLCYTCHPGFTTQCERDMHRLGDNCTKCHGGMSSVGNPSRRPWVDLPRCGSCHNVAGHEYEQPGVLYRNSVGHGGVKCEACHGSPHAIYPTIQPRDNVQSISLQGHAGKIDKCTLCHQTQPTEPFPHRRND